MKNLNSKKLKMYLPKQKNIKITNLLRLYIDILAIGIKYISLSILRHLSYNIYEKSQKLCKFILGSKSVQVHEKIIIATWNKNTKVKLALNYRYANWNNSLLNFKFESLLLTRNFAKLYSTESTKNVIGNWIAGFTDAEGCFRISITKNPKYFGDSWNPSLYNILLNNSSTIVSNVKAAMPLTVTLYFQIGLHIKDKSILDLLKSELGVGRYSLSEANKIQFIVSSFEDTRSVIAFFDKYQLITQKREDFLLYKKAYSLIANKKHLTIEGLTELVSLKSQNNWGLTPQLKGAFPNLAISKRNIINETITNHDWISGFTTGDGSFQIRITKSKKYALGVEVGLKYEVTQHEKDRYLMENLATFFKCGNLGVRGNIIDFRVTKLIDILEIIIPFFVKHPVAGEKLQDFNKFCEVAEMMRNKEHLTKKGLEKIKLIKSRVNIN